MELEKKGQTKSKVNRTRDIISIRVGIHEVENGKRKQKLEK
jgi:hypothetical protein